METILAGLQPLSKLTKPTAGGIIADAEARLLLCQECQGELALSRPHNPRLLQHVTQSLARKSLTIALGSENMAAQLLLSRSVDRIAAHFERLMQKRFPARIASELLF